MKNKKKMLHFWMNFGELFIDGLIDTSAITSFGSRFTEIPNNNTANGSKRRTTSGLPNNGNESTFKTLKCKSWTSIRSWGHFFQRTIRNHDQSDKSIIWIAFPTMKQHSFRQATTSTQSHFFSRQLWHTDNTYFNINEPLLNPTHKPWSTSSHKFTQKMM